MAGSLPAPDPSGSLKHGVLGTGSLVFMVAAATPLLAGGLLAFWLRGSRPAAYARIGEGDSETHTAAEGIPA